MLTSRKYDNLFSDALALRYDASVYKKKSQEAMAGRRFPSWFHDNGDGDLFLHCLHIDFLVKNVKIVKYYRINYECFWRAGMGFSCGLKTGENMKRNLIILNPVFGKKRANRYLTDIVDLFTKEGYMSTVLTTTARGRNFICGSICRGLRSDNVYRRTELLTKWFQDFSKMIKRRL